MKRQRLTPAQRAALECAERCASTCALTLGRAQQIDRIEGGQLEYDVRAARQQAIWLLGYLDDFDRASQPITPAPMIDMTPEQRRALNARLFNAGANAETAARAGQAVPREPAPTAGATHTEGA